MQVVLPFASTVKQPNTYIHYCTYYSTNYNTVQIIIVILPSIFVIRTYCLFCDIHKLFVSHAKNVEGMIQIPVL